MRVAALLTGLGLTLMAMLMFFPDCLTVHVVRS